MRDAITTAGEVVGLLMMVAALALVVDSMAVFLAVGGLVVAAVSSYEGTK